MANYKARNLLQFKVKTSDQTVNNSTTFVNDTELFVPVKANKTYSFILLLIVNSGTTPDIKYKFTYPSGATGDHSSTASAWSASQATIIDIATQYAPSTAGAIEYSEVRGRLIVSSTSGTLQLQFAQETQTVADTKILQGASLLVMEAT